MNEIAEAQRLLEQIIEDLNTGTRTETWQALALSAPNASTSSFPRRPPARAARGRLKLRVR